MKKVLLLLTLAMLLIGCANVIVEDPVLEETPSQEIIEPRDEAIEIERPAIDEPEEHETATPDAGPLPIEEKPISTLPADVQAVFDKASKVKSYSYLYIQPKTNMQYRVWIKGNKMRVDPVSQITSLYFDTEKETVEKYCISYSRCGRETGKIADLQYSSAYIETPEDWKKKITQAKIRSESDYQGKETVVMETDLGNVIIDQNFGVIYTITINADNEHRFRDVGFNRVKNEDVVPPKHLVPQ